MDVIESKVVSVEEVMGILADKKEGELTYEQQLALQHAKKFATTKAKSEKVRKALVSSGLLSEKGIVKIMEIMPKNQMTLRQILIPEKKAFSDEDINKILEITREN